jgi:RNA polymerase sigma-70 factor (ECF subfamily)
MYWSMSAMRYGGDAELIAALRAGDEAAFVQLVDTYGASLTRVAAIYVRDRAVVQEVVQETWIGVLRGIHRFEGRSSLRTWLFRILKNIAMTRAVKEGRSVPFAALSDEQPDEPAIPADRFQGPDSAWPDHWVWSIRPTGWATPLEALLSAETRELLRTALEQLPPMQRLVLSLRDIEGWSSEEVCEALDLSQANQRVVLHRARTKLRDVIDDCAVGERQ